MAYIGVYGGNGFLYDCLVEGCGVALYHVVVTIERNIHAVLEQQRLHVCDLISGIIHAVLCYVTVR